MKYYEALDRMYAYFSPAEVDEIEEAIIKHEEEVESSTVIDIDWPKEVE